MTYIFVWCNDLSQVPKTSPNTQPVQDVKDLYIYVDPKHKFYQRLFCPLLVEYQKLQLHRYISRRLKQTGGFHTSSTLARGTSLPLKRLWSGTAWIEVHIKKFQKQSKVPISMKHAVAFLENPFIKRNDMGIFHGYVCLPEGYIYGSSNVKCHVILAILPSFENNSRFSSTLKNRTWPAHELSKSRCIAHCKWVFILVPKVKTETSTQKFTIFPATWIGCNMLKRSPIYWPQSLHPAHCWQLQQLCPLWYLVGYGKRQINVAKSAIHPQ